MLRLACLLALIAGIRATPATAEARGLRLGFADDAYFGTDRAAWVDRTVATGGTVVRLSTTWASIAPAAPRAPTDPRDPAYRWERLDGAVRAASARGLDVVLGLGGAPRWAEGPGRPGGAPPGSWRPNAAAYGAFARAAALRYSGRLPDPLVPGAALPRVRTFQAWNEPNLPKYLTPQWEGTAADPRPVSPGVYRDLLNTFSDGVKSVSRANRVVAGSTAPFGDEPRRLARMPPVRFVRELLRAPARFDVLSHHPYAVSGPRIGALNAENVSIADMHRLRRVLRRAGQGGKRLWVTEVSWDSAPPDPDGVPARRHAQWTQEALYELWRQGVDTVTWFQIRDDEPRPSFAATNQSGMYLTDGRPKLSQRAFAFPLVLTPRAGGRARAWTRAPAAGRLVLQRRVAGRWRSIDRVSVRRHQVVQRSVRVPRGISVRARVSGLTSLSSRVP